ncbi:hypothetical protein [Moorena sp. SIO4A5]|uniref:hypothetical protein n=1 Tax=Moorena sp. SIO4A5 TaxID=2607838 RepID=UPI0025EF48E6|nr:hypothetical protein [Moorena sp. SIO4A5]
MPDRARISQHRTFSGQAARGLKNISVIEHTRHRSPVNFLINLLGGLIAYCQSAQKAFPLPRTGITWFRLTKTDV